MSLSGTVLYVSNKMPAGTCPCAGHTLPIKKPLPSHATVPLSVLQEAWASHPKLTFRVGPILGDWRQQAQGNTQTCLIRVLTGDSGRDDMASGERRVGRSVK